MCGREGEGGKGNGGRGERGMEEELSGGEEDRERGLTGGWMEKSVEGVQGRKGGKEGI